MRRNRLLSSAAIAVTCLVLAGCARSTTQVVVANQAPQQAAKPAQPPAVVKGAESGKKQILGSAQSIAPNCTVDGYPTVRVIRQPSNGQVSIEKDDAYPSFSKDNVRSACDTQKLPAVSFFYTSAAGFVGTDSLSLEVLFPDGNLKSYTFSVSVRAAS